MLNSPGSPTDAMRQSLSALMDGRTEEASVDRACAVWRTSAEARACWHTYHLIGDVLRSDELAAAPARDEAFLASLREKLAHEPVPMVPVPDARSVAWRQRMGVPMAVAAGFVAVAGVLVVMRGAAPEEAADALLAGRAPADLTVVNGQIVRDARLDRYLAAHRKVSNTASVQVPGAVVRSVDTVVLETK